MTESMEHILMGCMQGTTSLIWRLASEAWDHETYQWPRISFGIALGCGNLTAKTHRPQGEEPEELQGIPIGRRGVTRLISFLSMKVGDSTYKVSCHAGHTASH